jgi:hypothetical protein
VQAYCAAQGLPPPSMPTLPPHRSLHTHVSSLKTFQLPLSPFLAIENRAKYLIIFVASIKRWIE